MEFWDRYVPMAERRANACKRLKKLLKKGQEADPVVLEGRTIARSFWGKGWCDHLESFSDYENRLPRGRTYVRNGSVCHLTIQSGRIDAFVSGSSLYTLSIRIKELKPALWKTIKKKCSGRIGSMLELLQGKLSKEVMTIVADRKVGLFPQPGELEFRCSCPDGARMCKHVAAVLYGVGSRLDLQPELLFLLRDVDAQELIAADMAVPLAASGMAADTLATERLGDIFGIDLEEESDTRPVPGHRAKTKAKPKTAKPAKVSPTKKTKAMVAHTEAPPAIAPEAGKAGADPTHRKKAPIAKTASKPKAKPKAKVKPSARKRKATTAS